MQRRPLGDEALSPWREPASQDVWRVDAEGCFELAVDGMEVRGYVLAPIHEDDDPVELADPRHVASAPHQLVDRIRRLALHRRRDMRVPVERDGDRGVTEHLGNDLWMNDATEHQTRRRVTQIVKADSWKAGPVKQPIEARVDEVPAFLRTPIHAWEDEIESIPIRTYQQTLLSLRRLVLAQCIDGEGGQLNLAARFPGFRLMPRDQPVPQCTLQVPGG